MLFFVGDRYFGKVDHVPGMFYIKTRFLHIYYFPVVPRESYLFIDEEPINGERRGVRIRLCWRSVWRAWMRAGLGFVSASMMVAGFIQLTLPRQLGQESPMIKAVVCWTVAAICATAVGLSYLGTRATPTRARELAPLLGLSPDDVESRTNGF